MSPSKQAVECAIAVFEHLQLSYTPEEWDELASIIDLAFSAKLEAAQKMADALKEAKGPLEIYHAYGWPDRGGVREQIKTAIAAYAATETNEDKTDKS